tara:strand:+ start:25 stop:264 length:240 start_codon:yes stop_codon:yes gene_type:complete
MEWKMSDTILQYVNEQSIRGDLARELMGIMSDYESGTISAEDKSELLHEIMASYQASDLARDEVMWRWAISAATVVASI